LQLSSGLPHAFSRVRALALLLIQAFSALIALVAESVQMEEQLAFTPAVFLLLEEARF
jgi:hypothetical protein